MSIGLVTLLGLTALSGCSLPKQHTYTYAHPSKPPMAFAQDRSACNAEAYKIPIIERPYFRHDCLLSKGWYKTN